MSGLKIIFLGLFRKQKSFVIYGRTILPCTKSYPRKNKTTEGTLTNYVALLSFESAEKYGKIDKRKIRTK